MISTDRAGNKLVGIAHAKPPCEVAANEIEVDATIITNSSIELVDEFELFATVVTDPNCRPLQLLR